MRHMLLILVVAVMAFVGKRIIILSVQTAMMIRAIVEVMGVVMLIMMMTMLSLTAAMVALKVSVVVIKRVSVMKLVMLFV